MEALLGAALLVCLILIFRRGRRERFRLESLAETLRTRSRRLAEDEGDAGSSAWRRLELQINALIDENRSLAEARDGQLVQLRAVLDHLSEAVLVTDELAVVLLANGSARRMLGRDEDLAGKKLPRLLPSSEVVALIEDLRRGRAPGPGEIRVESAGKSLRLSLTGRLLPVPQGERAGPWALFILADITRERELEGLQKELIGNVSHELRTPISVIRGYAETLVADQERMDPDDRARFIQAIHRHSIRLADIVEDLLTLGRLESRYPGFEYELADMHGLIRELAGDFEARARASGQTIKLELTATDPKVRMDPFRMSQVLENLVGNALKYSAHGSEVRIRTHVSGEALVVGVWDNGPGIPAGDLPRIFERFYRVEKARSRDKGGTGLGLTIVREIVSLHGGRVWVESEEGRGSCFQFSLPLPGGESRPVESVAKVP